MLMGKALSEDKEETPVEMLRVNQQGDLTVKEPSASEAVGVAEGRKDSSAGGSRRHWSWSQLMTKCTSESAEVEERGRRRDSASSLAAVDARS